MVNHEWESVGGVGMIKFWLKSVVENKGSSTQLLKMWYILVCNYDTEVQWVRRNWKRVCEVTEILKRINFDYNRMLCYRIKILILTTKPVYHICFWLTTCTYSLDINWTFERNEFCLASKLSDYFTRSLAMTIHDLHQPRNFQEPLSDTYIINHYFKDYQVC